MFLGTLIGFQFSSISFLLLTISSILTTILIALSFIFKRYLLQITSLFLIGITNSFLFQFQPYPLSEGKYSAIIEIISLDKQTEKLNTYKAKIICIKSENKWKSVSEKIILKTTLPTEFSKNDQIRTQIELKKIQNFQNLKNFDRISYFKNQNIHFEVFLNAKATITTLKSPQNKIQELKSYLKKKIDTQLVDPKISAFTKSLLIGDRSSLDFNMKKHFMYTGTAHILAISGLHVGILFLVLKLFLFPFFKFRKTEFIGAVFVILTTIIYAYLAENPVSAIRATIMLSLYLIAKITTQKPLITNYLFCSVFIILLLQPNDIFNIGFYLSVGAVLSILMFYPLLPKISVNNKIILFCWELLMVTLAVQPIAALLSAYYFGYFPTYFLLSNFITIILLYIFIFFALLFLVTPLPFLNESVNFFGNLLFQLNEWIYKLPYSTLKLDWSFLEFSCFLVAVFCFYFGIVSKKLTWLNASLFAFIIGNTVQFLR